jgi:hypothetical protein
LSAPEQVPSVGACAHLTLEDLPTFDLGFDLAASAAGTAPLPPTRIGFLHALDPRSHFRPNLWVTKIRFLAFKQVECIEFSADRP